MNEPHVVVVLANECELRFPEGAWPGILRAIQEGKSTFLASDVHGASVVIRVDDISFACLMTSEVLESITRTEFTK